MREHRPKLLLLISSFEAVKEFYLFSQQKKSFYLKVGIYYAEGPEVVRYLKSLVCVFDLVT